MGTSHTVEIYVDVHDARALHQHAVALATSGENALSPEAAHDMLGSPDEPNIGDCLRWVFDPGESPPGASIQDSSCD